MTALSIYTGMTWALSPVVRVYLRRRLAAGKEDATRFEERFGRASRVRPDGPLVWAHGASIGEALSILPLIERLLQSHAGIQVLVTTGTVSSARFLANRLPERAFHQFVPVDLPRAVTGFLDHWKPDLVLWAESEFWPNILTRISRAGIPLVLLNGRVSEKSFAGWRRLRPLIRRMLRGFSLCLAQAPEDERALRDLGGDAVRCAGNLKFAVPPLPADRASLASLANRVGDRPTWLAASTHPGEEERVARAHRRLSEQFPGLLTLIAPRHPSRGQSIDEALKALGLQVALRSRDDEITPETDIYVADTIGEMGLWYRLANVVLLGGTLVPHGGQNPIEPAKLGCAIVAGPSMENFREIAREMENRRAARFVSNDSELTDALGALLSDSVARGNLAHAAEAYVREQSSVLERVVGELQPFMAALRQDAKGVPAGAD